MWHVNMLICLSLGRHIVSRSLIHFNVLSSCGFCLSIICKSTHNLDFTSTSISITDGVLDTRLSSREFSTKGRGWERKGKSMKDFTTLNQPPVKKYFSEHRTDLLGLGKTSSWFMKTDQSR